MVCVRAGAALMVAAAIGAGACEGGVPAVEPPPPGELDEDSEEAYRALGRHLAAQRAGSSGAVELRADVAESLAHALMHAHTHARAEGEPWEQVLTMISRGRAPPRRAAVDRRLRRGRRRLGRPVARGRALYGRSRDRRAHPRLRSRGRAPAGRHARSLRAHRARASKHPRARRPLSIRPGRRAHAAGRLPRLQVDAPAHHGFFRTAGEGSRRDLAPAASPSATRAGWKLELSVGWGDCPSGCISRHWIDVAVSANGEVALLGSEGAELETGDRS